MEMDTDCILPTEGFGKEPPDFPQEMVEMADNNSVDINFNDFEGSADSKDLEDPIECADDDADADMILPDLPCRISSPREVMLDFQSEEPEESTEETARESTEEIDYENMNETQGMCEGEIITCDILPSEHHNSLPNIAVPSESEEDENSNQPEIEEFIMDDETEKTNEDDAIDGLLQSQDNESYGAVPSDLENEENPKQPENEEMLMDNETEKTKEADTVDELPQLQESEKNKTAPTETAEDSNQPEKEEVLRDDQSGKTNEAITVDELLESKDTEKNETPAVEENANSANVKVLPDERGGTTKEDGIISDSQSDAASHDNHISPPNELETDVKIKPLTINELCKQKGPVSNLTPAVDNPSPVANNPDSSPVIDLAASEIIDLEEKEAPATGNLDLFVVRESLCMMCKRKVTGLAATTDKNVLCKRCQYPLVRLSRYRYRKNKMRRDLGRCKGLKVVVKRIEDEKGKADENKDVMIIENVVECIEIDDDDDDARTVEILKCSFCPKRYDNPVHLIVHEASHPKKAVLLRDSRFNCDICGLYCVNESLLTSHRSAHRHTSKTTVVKVPEEKRCDVCGKYFKTESTLKAHRSKFHPNAGAEKCVCDVCGDFFPDESVLATHRATCRSKLPELKSHRCDACGDAFEEEPLLTAHRDECRRGRVCHFCGDLFADESAFETHRGTCRANSAEPTYPCDRCSDIFDDEGALSTHRATHRQMFRCDICNLAFPQESSLTAHRSAHLLRSEPQRIPTMHRCDECGEAFALERTLTEHRSAFHPPSALLRILSRPAKSKDTAQIAPFSHEPQKRREALSDFALLNDRTVFVTYLTPPPQDDAPVAGAVSADSGREPAAASHSCDVCRACFATPDFLDAHRRSHLAKRKKADDAETQIYVATPPPVFAPPPVSTTPAASPLTVITLPPISRTEGRPPVSIVPSVRPSKPLVPSFPWAPRLPSPETPPLPQVHRMRVPGMPSIRFIEVVPIELPTPAEPSPLREIPAPPVKRYPAIKRKAPVVDDIDDMIPVSIIFNGKGDGRAVPSPAPSLAPLRLRCDFCEAGFGSAEELGRHRARPSVDCPVCETSFCDQRALHCHRAIAHADRPPPERPEEPAEPSYGCMMCPQRFLDTLILNRHLIEAHGLKKYNCGLCDRVFQADKVLSQDRILLKPQLGNETIVAYLCKECSQT